MRPAAHLVLTTLLVLLASPQLWPADAQKPSRDSYKYLSQGDRYFSEDPNSADALSAYSKAFDAELRTRQLDPLRWLRLMDRYALLQCRIGDPKKAEAAAQLGLERDPASPLLFFDLACAAARRKDAVAALANLRKAFEFEKNLPKGQLMRDPRQEHAFHTLMNESDFRSAVDSLVAHLDHYEFPLPGQPWKIAITLPAFHPYPTDSPAKPGAPAYFLNETDTGQINASVSLVASPPPVTLDACHASLEQQRRDTPRVFVPPYEVGNLSMMEHQRVAQYYGENYTSRVLLVCVPEDSAYLFIEFSRYGNFSTKDRALFTEILNSIRFLPAGKSN